jgi:hypothetical protein
LIKTMAAVVQSLDPNLPWAHLISMDSLLAEVLAGERFEAILFAGFAVIAPGIQRRGHEAGRLRLSPVLCQRIAPRRSTRFKALREQ